MTRVVVLGGGFGDVEVIRRLERKRGGRVDAEVLLISDLRFFPRDSAIMRQPPRCAVCAPHARSSWERDVA
jgi:NADH dehydrogenase FAD-containing subunit